jgi:hypothetical protein
MEIEPSIWVERCKFYVNSFLNTFLRIFNSSFPIIQRKHRTLKSSNITWITQGIKISCKHKKELYLILKKNEDICRKLYYKKYCKILSEVIIAAKRMAYDNHIKKLCNKMRTTWKIINTGTGRNMKKNYMQHLIDKYNDKNVAELLNEYFLMIANKLINTVNNNQNNPTGTYYMSFKEQAIINNCPNISNKPSTVKDTKKSSVLLKQRILVVMTKYLHEF